MPYIYFNVYQIWSMHLKFFASVQKEGKNLKKMSNFWRLKNGWHNSLHLGSGKFSLLIAGTCTVNLVLFGQEITEVWTCIKSYIVLHFNILVLHAHAPLRFLGHLFLRVRYFPIRLLRTINQLEAAFILTTRASTAKQCNIYICSSCQNSKKASINFIAAGLQNSTYAPINSTYSQLQYHWRPYYLNSNINPQHHRATIVLKKQIQFLIFL